MVLLLGLRLLSRRLRGPYVLQLRLETPLDVRLGLHQQGAAEDHQARRQALHLDEDGAAVRHLPSAGRRPVVDPHPAVLQEAHVGHYVDAVLLEAPDRVAQVGLDVQRHDGAAYGAVWLHADFHLRRVANPVHELHLGALAALDEVLQRNILAVVPHGGDGLPRILLAIEAQEDHGKALEVRPVLQERHPRRLRALEPVLGTGDDDLLLVVLRDVPLADPEGHRSVLGLLVASAGNP
mmetsp:Transcript_106688/g.283774  ORF Transcript_106688/g.283774 Transcript_106688/m.283774 type:complete len:237 (-) Transcript_106688:434-1144(-)